MSDHVPLRDFVERIIEENNRRRDDLRTEDRRFLEQSLLAVAKALELQAREYERRLEDLNHAHELAKETLGTYLPREMYERAHAEVVEWQRKADIAHVDIENRIKSTELGLVNLPGGIKSLELGLAAQSGHQAGSIMTRATAFTIAGVTIAAIAGLIGLLSYLK